MLNWLNKQWSVRVLAFSFIVLAVGAVESFHRNQVSFLKNESAAEAKKHLSVIRSRLEAAIVSDIYVLNSLSTLITVNPDAGPKEWEKIAANIIREGTHVKIIGLAKDDVINFVYPFRGNEKAIGVAYRDVPDQWESVRIAHEIEQIFISGPVDLVQGGKGLIARNPIFTDPPFNKDYWGVCSAIIDFQSLFKDVGVENFELKYRLGIRGLNSTGKEGAIFYGDSSVFEDAFATEQVNFPYGSWYIAASLDGDALADLPWYRVYFVRLVGYVLLFVLSLAFMTIYQLYTMARSRSLHDELTKLPNRRYFIYSLKQQFDSARKHGTETFAVMNLDLDKFKAINDTYGHAAGDKVLVACAERLKSVLRSSDIVARIGGDEFLILLPRVKDDVDARAISQKLQRVICGTPVIYEQDLIYLKVSIGWVTYDSCYEDVDALIRAADERMYEEKRQALHAPNFVK
ncbi:sensor domain-containing diguanylate cyclase [Vibrio kagoshimensis]|uniref:diguanylate cyclase domain-containing protein n=1 Tax=Vibrio kagoshimensis TaxID=2910244 RepID=UPI003D1B272A